MLTEETLKTVVITGRIDPVRKPDLVRLLTSVQGMSTWTLARLACYAGLTSGQANQRLHEAAGLVGAAP